jgi:hypothetical protein
MDIFNQIEKPYSMRSSEEEVALFTATKNAIQYYMIDTDIIKNQDTSLKKIKI